MTLGNALVTGASKRIGRAIAEGLAKEGWSVAVHARAADVDANAVASGIIKMGRRAAIVAADLADEAAVKMLIPRAAKALRGPITLLVNNASAFEHDNWDTATRESWDLHLEANLRAPFLLTQEFARALPAETEGVIINLLDQRVWNLTDQFVSYTVSKAGLWALTQTMALALAPRIRVAGIGPGPTMPSKHQSEEQFAAQAEATPLGIPATTADINRAVQFILNTPSFTGQMLALDGGQHLQPFRRPVLDQ
jgi:NAD(P)-dependent dehydrogenase (short-subunit alcohol dehydrogenase family)